MTYFKEALSAPTLHFKRLRSAEPLLCNGTIDVHRTHSAIETEIEIEGRRFLLSLPFRAESLRHIEHLESIAQERSRGPLLENYILYDELTMFDSLGGRHSFDIILQERPSGMTLNEAVHHYCAGDLREAVRKMKARLDAIGFLHNNLTPTNIIICESGIARPLRYWYAEWKVFCDNDISQLLSHIDNLGNDALNAYPTPLLAKDCEAEYVATSNNTIRRVRKGGRYGFIDGDGYQITPFEYSWASEFREGRAIVAKSGKMGAIDSNGHKVIFVVYKSLDFDLETGLFTATNDRYRYLIDYNGAIIRRTKLEEEEDASTAIEHF